MKLYTLTQLLNRKNESAISLAKNTLLEKLRYNDVPWESFNSGVEDVQVYISEKLTDYGISVVDTEIENGYGLDINIIASFNRHNFSNNLESLYMNNLKNDFIKYRTVLSWKKNEDLTPEEHAEIENQTKQYIEKIKENDFFSKIITDSEQEILEVLDDVLGVSFEPILYTNREMFYLETINDYTDCTTYEILQAMKQLNMKEFQKFEIPFFLVEHTDDEDEELDDYYDEVIDIFEMFFKDFVATLEEKGTDLATQIFNEVESAYADVFDYYESDRYWIDRIDYAEDYDDYLFTEQGEFICEEYELDDIEIILKGVSYTSEDFVLETAS